MWDKPLNINPFKSHLPQVYKNLCLFRQIYGETAVAKKVFTSSWKSTSIIFSPHNSSDKIAPFRISLCSISTIILPFKIPFQYGLINAHIVTPLFSPWHKEISILSYRPLCSRIWARGRLVILPKLLKPQRDLRRFVFTGWLGINTKWWCSETRQRLNHVFCATQSPSSKTHATFLLFMEENHTDNYLVFCYTAF